MAGHATTSNAAPACQARQQRLRPTGIGSKYLPINKCVFGFHNRRVAALAPACSARTAAHSPPCTASGSVRQNSHLFLAKYFVQRYVPDIGHTTTLKAGARVVELGSNDIKIGTVIGTMEDGKWPGKAHNNHVGIFGGANSRSVTTGRMMSFVLVEQYRANGVTRIQARVIYSKGQSANGRYIDPSNNADAFFVIEK